jgi:hypothetical protein
MKWNNALRDAPPVHNQEVLISVEGVYYVTTYDAGKNWYVLRDDKRQHFEPSERNVFYWVAIEDAPRTRQDY